MSQFEQLERYKKLLDEGIITEEEFRKIKQKILGLKASEEEEQQDREEALAEIEKMRAAEVEEKVQAETRAEAAEIERLRKIEEERMTQAEAERKKTEEAQRISVAELHENYQNIYSAEKAKERARREVLEEFRQREKQEQQEQFTKIAKTTINFVKEIVLWLITIFLLLVALAGLISPKLLNICVGVLSFILAVMACPLVTKKTRHIEKLKGYYKYKIVIVILVVILLMAVFCFLG